MKLARKYDRQNEVLLDKHMCTELCPCFSIHKWQKDENGNNIKRIDAESQYLALSEQMLNKHHRTTDFNKTWYTPLTFTADPKTGFLSFK